MEDFAYPLNDDWTTDEIIDVIACLRAVEKAYTTGVSVREFQPKYQAFKQIVTSIGEEKRLGREFERLSGFSLYRVVKESRRIQDQQLPQKTKIKLK